MSEDCRNIHQLFNGLKMHSFPFNENEIPKNGVYILFQKGEKSHSLNRIVRIGTHTGKNQLRSRICQHFLIENKDRSIFRKNIGRALLNKTNDGYLEKWELDLTTKEAKEKYSNVIDLKKQKEIENQVSKFIRDNFFFGVFQVDDKNKRLEIESKIISTISLCNECKPSSNWLGTFSPKGKIRKSGLWLVNGLWKKPLLKSEIEWLGNSLSK